MITTVGMFKIQSDKREAFLAFARDLVTNSLSEDGCTAYGIYEDITKPGVFSLIEIWASQEMLDAHYKTAHFKRFRNEFAAFLAEEPVFQTYHADE